MVTLERHLMTWFPAALGTALVAVHFGQDASLERALGNIAGGWLLGCSLARWTVGRIKDGSDT